MGRYDSQWTGLYDWLPFCKHFREKEKWGLTNICSDSIIINVPENRRSALFSGMKPIG